MNLYKLAIFFIFLTLYSVIAYKVTGSLAISSYSVIGFLFVWIVGTNLFERWTSTELKKIVEKFGDDHRFPRESDFAEGYYFLRDHVGASSTVVIDKGIFIYSVSVCSSVIPWSNIARTRKLNRDGNLLLRLYLDNGIVSDSGLSIPWLDQYDCLLPKGLMIEEQ